MVTEEDTLTQASELLSCIAADLFGANFTTPVATVVRSSKLRSRTVPRTAVFGTKIVGLVSLV